MRRLIGSPALALNLLVFCTAIAISVPFELASQVVTGRIVEPETGNGVEGAIVSLLQEDDSPVARVLTDGGGRFRLRSSEAGRFHLTSQRIGFADSTSEVFELGRGQRIDILLEASIAAVLLEGLVVTSDSRCDLDYRSAEPTDQLWREARKALTAAVLTGATRLYRFRVRQYTRELRPGSLRVVGEDGRTFAAVESNPIKSLPVEDLRRHGYVRSDSLGDFEFYAPDAEVLLSDEFLDGHCFRVERDPKNRAGLIGLGFQPTPEVEQPDVAGALWLDESTAELRYLEYRYSELPWPVGNAPIGGRVDFERLPSGGWIVRKWRIRMPQMAEIQVGRGSELPRLVVDRIKETGGEILEIRELNRAVVRASVATEDPAPAPGGTSQSPSDSAIVLPPAEVANVSPATPSGAFPAILAGKQTVWGTVVDDESGVPIQTVEVALLSVDDSIVGRYVTDENGRFVARTPDAGSYRLRAMHIGYAPAMTDAFELAPGEDGMAELGMHLSPVVLDGLEAVVEGQSLALARVGFYRREQMGFGQIRTPEYLEAKQPIDIADLFFGMNGVAVVRPRGSFSYDVFSTRRPLMETCRPSVSIDRQVVQMGGKRSSGWQETLNVIQVGAMEVYAGAGGLPEWVAGSINPCGAILIWTKGYTQR